MKLLLSLIIVALVILFCWYFFGPPYPVEPPKTYPSYEKVVEPVSQPYNYEPGGKG